MLSWLSFSIIVASFIPLVAAGDHFIFSTSFQCYYRDRETYSYRVQFFERDSILSGDDEITKKVYNTIRTGTTFVSIEGDLEDDEVATSGYDVYAKIWHTCTKDKKEVLLTINMTPKCPVGKKICHYQIKRDLTNSWGIYNEKYELKHDSKPF